MPTIKEPPKEVFRLSISLQRSFSKLSSTWTLEIDLLALSFDIRLAMDVWKDFLTLKSLETWPRRSAWKTVLYSRIAPLLGKLSPVLAAVSRIFYSEFTKYFDTCASSVYQALSSPLKGPGDEASLSL